MSDPGLLLDPTGRPVRVPPGELQGWLDLGYTRPSSASSDKILTRENAVKEEGGFGGGLEAFGEGAADAATFGGSTWLETKLFGANPERIKLREELHPVAHGLGTTAGIVAPLAIGDWAGAPALIGKLGTAAERATVSALPEAVGLGGRLLNRAASKGVGGAVEGLVYGASDINHEAALGDPVFTGESLARLAVPAMLGGVLGGGSGVLGEAAKSAAPRVVPWLRDFQTNQYGAALGAGRKLDAAALEAAGDAGYLGPFTTAPRFLDKATRGLEKATSEMEALAKDAGGEDISGTRAWQKASKAREVAAQSVDLAQQAVELAGKVKQSGSNPVAALEVLEYLHGGGLAHLGGAALSYAAKKYGPATLASLAGALKRGAEGLGGEEASALTPAILKEVRDADPVRASLPAERIEPYDTATAQTKAMRDMAADAVGRPTPDEVLAKMERAPAPSEPGPVEAPTEPTAAPEAGPSEPAPVPPESTAAVQPEGPSPDGAPSEGPTVSTEPAQAGEPAADDPHADISMDFDGAPAAPTGPGRSVPSWLHDKVTELAAGQSAAQRAFDAEFAGHGGNRAAPAVVKAQTRLNAATRQYDELAAKVYGSATRESSLPGDSGGSGSMAPVPAAQPHKDLKPNGPLVSTMTSKVDPKIASVADLTLSAVDKVHGDGLMRPFEFEGFIGGDAKLGRHAGNVLGVNTTTPYQHITAAHELFHEMHEGAFRFGHSEEGKNLADVIKAIRGTRAATVLQERTNQIGQTIGRIKIEADALAYYADEAELLARAYPQYIAIRSGNRQMRSEIRAMLSSDLQEAYHVQWTEPDFTPIAQAFDAFFERIHWLKRGA